MGIYAVKPVFQDILRPVATWLARRNIHPTWINLAALITSLLAGVLLATTTQSYEALFIPLLVFIRIALNALDGMVARINDVGDQAWGEVMNELIDRFSDAVIFTGLALNPAVSDVAGFLTALLVVLTSFIAVVSKAAGGSRRYEGVMGKADRMIVIGVLSLVLPWVGMAWYGDIALGIVFGGCLITIGQRLLATRGEIRGG